jgi:hypothetical protein
MTQQNALLNAVANALYRSLLQYAEECWPWSGGLHGSNERAAVHALSRAQREHVGKMVELLEDRNWTVDFDNYPYDFTNLNYVGIDYLVQKLIADEERLLSQTEQTLPVCHSDAEASELLRNAAAAQRESVQRLRQLKAAGTPPAVVAP